MLQFFVLIIPGMAHQHCHYTAAEGRLAMLLSALGKEVGSGGVPVPGDSQPAFLDYVLGHGTEHVEHVVTSLSHVPSRSSTMILHGVKAAMKSNPPDS